MYIEDGKNLEMNKYKSIIVGCGKIGSLSDEDYFLSHANAYKKNRNFKLVCGVDIKKANRKKFENKFKVSSSKNLINAINDHKPDIISVCTPDKTHYTIVKQILINKNIPRIIFLEKPCFQNMSELKEIKKLANLKNVVMIINHSKRFDPKITLLKNLFLKKKFGKIRSIYSTYYNGWMHNGVHIIDMIVYLFNSKLKIVNFLKPYFRKKGNIDIHLKDNKNNFDLFVNSVDEKNFQYFKMEFFFEKFFISINNFGKEIFIKKVTKNKIGEKILGKKNYKFKSQKISPINNSLNIILKYFKEKDKSLLKEYDLDAIQKTMVQMWEIKKIHANRY